MRTPSYDTAKGGRDFHGSSAWPGLGFHIFHFQGMAAAAAHLYEAWGSAWNMAPPLAPHFFEVSNLETVPVWKPLGGFGQYTGRKTVSPVEWLRRYVEVVNAKSPQGFQCSVFKFVVVTGVGCVRARRQQHTRANPTVPIPVFFFAKR